MCGHLMLILVRHALPAFRPEISAEEWVLDDDRGRRGADSLTQVLPSDAVLVSSYELKARQTLEPSGLVTPDARFGEVRREEPFDSDFRARRRAYVSGVDQPGWEPRAAVVARFSVGVRAWYAACGEQPLVIASHGVAITVWLTATIGLKDPVAFWNDLRLPDVLQINLLTRTVKRIESTSLFQIRQPS
jgi:broad specificity phosphatase PhoE